MDKSRIYTRVGWYHAHEFITIDGEIIECTVYKKIALELDEQPLCVVNMKFIPEDINAWIIFQAVVLDEETSKLFTSQSYHS